MVQRVKRFLSASDFFGNRFIRVILISSLFLQIGVWMRNFAILLFVMEMTNNDTVAVSLLYVAEYAPILIFSVIGGTFADRWKPKKTMIYCDLLSALSLLTILAALIAGSWKAIFFTTLLSAILSQFSQPSGMKLFKQHVPEEHIQTGMAMYQTLISVFVVIGPVFGTFVYSAYGIKVSLTLVAIAFVLSAVTLTLLPPDKMGKTRNKRDSFWFELRGGFTYVLQNPALRLLGIAFGLGGVAVGIIQPLGIFIVVDQLQLDKEYYQWFASTNVVATVAGGLLVVGISKLVPSQKILAIGNLFSAFSVIGMGFSTLLFLSLAMQFIRGFVLPFIQVGINSIVMKTTDEAYVGRVNGAFGPIFMGSMVLMTMVSGWLSTFLPLSFMYLCSGIAFIVSTVVISLMFRLKLQINPIADMASNNQQKTQSM
ncbi:MFS transporter [Paenibacillus sp. KS-LC4]|uniref:MFS transporter n=1 Tax=Paenibacillus sp. KS-LC4 TaxID=2979727 RepID=UPI0030D2411F